MKKLYGLKHNSENGWELIADLNRATFLNYEAFMTKDGDVVSSMIKKHDDLEPILQEMEMVATWKPNENYLDLNKAVDPNHYKNYIDDMQWLDAMSKLPTMKDTAAFSAALELQVRKYLDRRGQKDDTKQELRKALFYLAYLVKYVEAKGGFNVNTIQKWLKKL